jgi:hypothetical protein
VGSTKQQTTAVIDPAQRLEAVGEPVPDRRKPVDRRQAPRIKMPKVLADIVSRGLPVTVLEIGLGGMSVVSESEFSVGEMIDLRCRTANRAPIVLRLEARHCRPDAAPGAPPRYVTGFRFAEAWSPGDRSPVDALIEQIINVLSVDKDR